jgi:hypothetical protein
MAVPDERVPEPNEAVEVHFLGESSDTASPAPRQGLLEDRVHVLRVVPPGEQLSEVRIILPDRSQVFGAPDGSGVST